MQAAVYSSAIFQEPEQQYYNHCNQGGTTSAVRFALSPDRKLPSQCVRLTGSNRQPEGIDIAVSLTNLVTSFCADYDTLQDEAAQLIC